jgi:hypothetical protein
MRHFRRIVAALAVGICLLGASVARAGFIGASVQVQAFNPTLASPITSPLTATVGPGVEFSNFISLENIDVGDTTIRLTSLTGTAYISSTFNGYVFTFTGAPAITGVTADASSTFNPVNIAFTANTITVNYSGVADPPQSFSQLDVTFAATGGSSVPLPAGAWAGLIGLAACGLAAAPRGSRWLATAVG